jgi:hypothetical protein
MKGCLILFGESFRLGGQNTRNRGSDNSYCEQIKAAQSHINFIKSIQNTDFKVYISSYSTKFNDDLTKVYSDYLIGFDFYDNLIGVTNLISNTIKNISNVEVFDFILFMRIDLFLENKFIEIFNPNWNKILFPSICFKPYHKCGIHPRVNDMMLYFPKKYFKYIKFILYNDGHTGHRLWETFINQTDLTYEDLDTILETYHDSDSEKDYNPIYYIVNRNRAINKNTNSKDYFDKYNFF